MIRIIFFSMILHNVYNRCTFTVLDDVSVPTTPVDPETFFGSPDQCPQYNGSQVCCNDLQNDQMRKNFQAIEATFGSAGGGCDICSANLKRFWCEYTCNPNQQKFLKDNGEVYVPDPLDSDRKKKVLVQNVTITMTPQAACDLWSSCKRTQFASQVSAMQSPGGFFNFQGANGITQARQIITVSFSDDPEQSLQMSAITQCNYNATNTTVLNEKTIYIDPFGFQITQNCSCNNCDLSCANNIVLYQPTGVMEGFNNVLVVSVWGCVIVITILITVVRGYLTKKRKNIRVSEESQQLLLI